MTTQERTSSGGTFLIILMIGGILLFVVMNASVAVLDGETLSVTDHATEKHGAEVNKAVQVVTGCEPGCRYDCKDGRQRYVNNYKEDGQWKWAVVVKEGDTIVTAFITASQRYIRMMLNDNGCSNGFSHP